MPNQIRKFLVVVDETPECRVALRFAARRAQHTGGRIVLLSVAPPVDFSQWGGVEEIMKDEAHQAAKALIDAAAASVKDLAGIEPELVIEHGEAAECLLGLIARDRAISILVLASGTSKDGPGPLIKLFAAKLAPIPFTVVPGDLSDEAIDDLA